MSVMREAGRALAHLQEAIRMCEPCPERDEMQARFDLTLARLKDSPRRIAMQGPFATAEEAEQVMRDEMEYVLAAFEAPLPS
jgi:hypothetical protein